MIKKMSFVLLIILPFQLSFADVSLQTSIRDVYVDGQDELIGSIAFNVNANDFPDLNSGPVYLRLSLTEGVTFSRTIVDPLVGKPPINLITRLRNYSGSSFENAMLPTDIQLVRAVMGENRFWIRINRASGTWLDTDGDGVGDAPPNQDHEIAFTIGVEAGIFNTSDTRLWVDFANSGCGTLEVGELFGFDPVAFSSLVDPGTPGLPETAAHESYDHSTCTYNPTVDMSLLAFAPVNFSSDYLVGRGYGEPTVGVEIFAADTVAAGEPFVLIGNLSGHVNNARVHWNFGDDDKRSMDSGNIVEHTYFNPGTFEVQATVSNAAGFTGTAVKTITVLSSTILPDQAVLVPHVTLPNNGFRTKLIIENTKSTEQEFQIQGFDKDGHLLSTTDFSINAAADAPSVLKYNPIHYFGTSVSHCVVIGNVSAAASYATSGADSNPIHTQLSNRSAKKWMFHSGNWDKVWDGLAIVNTGSAAADISFKQFTETGQMLTEVLEQQPVAPGGKILKVINSGEFVVNPGSFFVIESSQPVQILSLQGASVRGEGLMWTNRIVPIDN